MYYTNLLATDIAAALEHRSAGQQREALARCFAHAIRTWGRNSQDGHLRPVELPTFWILVKQIDVELQKRGWRPIWLSKEQRRRVLLVFGTCNWSRPYAELSSQHLVIVRVLRRDGLVKIRAAKGDAPRRVVIATPQQRWSLLREGLLD